MVDQMKIVQVGARFATDTSNGVDRAVTSYAVGQAAAGHTVTLVNWLPIPEPLEREIDGNLRELSLPRPCGVSVGAPGAEFLRAMDGVADVVHFHSAFVLRHCRLAGMLRESPYVVSPHGAYSPAGLVRSRWKKLGFRELFDRRYLNGAAGIHALTEREADDVRAYASTTTPVFVIPNPVETAELPGVEERRSARGALGLMDDEPYVVLIARLDVHHKGIDLLIEAAADLWQRAPAVRVAVIGPPDPRHPDVATLIPEWATAAIRVLPPVYGAEKRRHLAAADVFVSASRSEGLPTAILEALAHGTDVVTTDTSDLSEVVRELGGEVVATEAGALSAGLERAIHRIRGLELDQGARARRAATVAGRFAASDVMDAFDAMYATVVGDKRQGLGKPTAGQRLGQ